MNTLGSMPFSKPVILTSVPDRRVPARLNATSIYRRYFQCVFFHLSLLNFSISTIFNTSSTMSEGKESPSPQRQTGAQLHEPPGTGVRSENKTSEQIKDSSKSQLEVGSEKSLAPAYRRCVANTCRRRTCPRTRAGQWRTPWSANFQRGRGTRRVR